MLQVLAVIAVYYGTHDIFAAPGAAIGAIMFAAIIFEGFGEDCFAQLIATIGFTMFAPIIFVSVTHDYGLTQAVMGLLAGALFFGSLAIDTKEEDSFWACVVAAAPVGIGTILGGAILLWRRRRKPAGI